MALSEHIPTEAIDSFLAFIEVIGKIGDFDAAVRGAWENGKMVDIKKRDLQMIALPLAQLLITSHAKTYPTAEEFTNFAKALVAADSDQLASYALDILQHVFGGTIDIDQHRSNIFFMPEKIAAYKKNKPASLNAFKNIYKNFCAKWGFSDLEECPSWYKGFQLISKKYGDSFSAAKVGDLDGLG